jgi:hypothetical protein
MIGGDLQSPGVHPVLVVRPVDVGVIAPVAPIAAQVVGEGRLKVGRLLVAQDVLAGDIARALQRRARGVVPDALQVRIAPRRARRRVFFGSLGAGSHDEADRQERRDEA